MGPDRGFFGSLFDISFSSFVTTKIIKVLYVLGIILAAIVALAMIIGSFQASIGRGILMLLIGGPLIFLIYVILLRVWLEIIIVVFRIGENVEQIAQAKKDLPPPPATLNV